MKKTIWIINEYAGSPYHGMTFRHYYLAKELLQFGYDVSIITSSFSHLLHTLPNVTSSYSKETIDGIEYVWVKMPPYQNSQGFKRILNWLLFAFKLLFLPWVKPIKPDFILVSSLPLTPILPAYLLSKLMKAKLLFEVRDIWPLSAIELGGYSSKHPLIVLLQWLEDFAYKHAWKVISVIPYAYEHMQRRGLERAKFNYIPNGTDITLLNNKPLPLTLNEVLPQDKFIIGYTGAIGIANALEYLVEAARILHAQNEICFVIVGNGALKNELIQRAENLSNIIFIPAISKEYMPAILSTFDVCYIGWRDLKIYNYGVSANKLFDYMLSQKPIIHSIQDHNDIVTLAQCGICVAPENSEAIAQAIQSLYQMPAEERAMLGRQGKEYVLKHHTYSQLAQKLIYVLEND